MTGIAGALGPFRRRAALAVFVRASSGIGIIAMAAVPAIAWFSGSTGAAIAIAAGITLVAATVVAFARRPSLPATARVVDAALGLRNRTATALECADAQDAIAALIKKDAARALAAGSPVQVFPLAVTARWRQAAAAAVVIAVAGWLAPPAERSADVSPMNDTGRAIGGGSLDGDRAATPGERAARSNESMSDTRGVAADAPDPSRPVAAPQRVESRGGSMTPRGEPAGSVSGETGESARAGLAATPPAADAPTLRPATAGGARGTATGGGPSELAAGGLSGESAGGSHDRPAPAVGEARTGSAARTLADSDRAAAGERPVPPALRAYIRRYFEAISR